MNLFYCFFEIALYNEINGTRKGVIMSPGYPNKFHSKEEYIWRIIADKDYVISLKLSEIIDVDIPFIKVCILFNN